MNSLIPVLISVRQGLNEDADVVMNNIMLKKGKIIKSMIQCIRIY